MKNYKASWSTSLIIISTLATILCVGISTGMLWNPGGMPPLFALLPLAILFGSALFTIRGYAITSDAILVQRLFWTTRLPLAGLQSAQFDPTMPKPIRLGARAIGFLESEADLWISKRVQESRAQEAV